MKDTYPIRVVLVHGDSAPFIGMRASVYDTFTTVRFEHRRRAAIVKYGSLWNFTSRRFY